jgi:hypothetical protein
MPPASRMRLKMETAGSLQMALNVYQNTCHIPEESNIYKNSG